MEKIKMINDHPIVNLIVTILLSCLAGSILVTSFVLAGDIYGAGPGFVAVSGGLGLCAFVGHLWYARVKQTTHFNLHFGICIIITVSAIQQAVLFGGLTGILFQEKIFEVYSQIANETDGVCKKCLAADTGALASGVGNITQEVDAEAAMCFFQSLLFVVMIPFTFAQFVSRDSAPAGGQQDNLDYSPDYGAQAAESSTAEYTDL